MLLFADDGVAVEYDVAFVFVVGVGCCIDVVGDVSLTSSTT